MDTMSSTRSLEKQAPQPGNVKLLLCPPDLVQLGALWPSASLRGASSFGSLRVYPLLLQSWFGPQQADLQPLALN